MARPKLVIDEAKIEALALAGASTNEIALILDVDDQTLHNRFSKFIEKKRAERRVQLREWQAKAAQEGNPAMLIWLGKNQLGQVDKHEPIVTRVTVQYADRGIDGDPDETAQGSEEDPA